MLKDASYHKAAIQYNEELAVFAGELADRITHREIKRWCKSVAKQHKEHADFHKKSLAKLERQNKKTEGPSDAITNEVAPSIEVPETVEEVSA